MNDVDHYLIARAGRLAAAYVEETGPRAVLLTGSAAEGGADHLSDLDLIVYHDRLPGDEPVAAARSKIVGWQPRPSPPRSSDALIELFDWQGIECQLLHTTVAEWERQMATVLDEHSTTSLAQKALDGLLGGVALHGGDLIYLWQARAADYPDPLARAMVEQYLTFFPLWQVHERLATRDAMLWEHQILVEASQNILGVLAGVNRLYYSTFQFKRLRRFVGRMRHAPERLADRLAGLFTLARADAAAELERLVSETVALVETHLSEIDTRQVRASLGRRQRPWLLPGASSP